MFQRFVLRTGVAAAALLGLLSGEMAGAQGRFDKELERPIPLRWSAGDSIPASIAALMEPADSVMLRDNLKPVWDYTPKYVMEVPGGDDPWWRDFGDEMLDSLINLGVERNYNLLVAMRRTETARYQMMQARAGWFPSIGLSAGWTKAKSSGALAGGTPYHVSPSSYFNAGLSAQWEIDIFGKIASGVKAKKASYRASRAEYVGAMVSLTAQIASTYLNLRTLQKEYEVAKRHAESQMKIVKIAEARFEVALASKYDVAQAWETYYSTQASIPMLENSIHQAMNSIAMLIGDYPDEVYPPLSVPKAMPSAERLILAGVPADLLRRRPDIAQAEQELAAYAAQVGIAKKDFLPSLTLSGAIGTESRDFDHLFGKNSFTWSVAPTLSWTLFDGLNRKYALAEAKEAFKMGIDNYNYTVMNAVEETDAAMATYYNSLRHMEALQKVIEQNDEALRLAIERYKNSLTPMSDVVTAQLNALSAESQLVSAQGDALSALVSLYEALGGSY